MSWLLAEGSERGRRPVVCAPVAVLVVVLVAVRPGCFPGAGGTGLAGPGQALPPPTGAAAWISSRAALSTQQGIGASGDFPIQLDPAASFVQFACDGGID